LLRRIIVGRPWGQVRGMAVASNWRTSSRISSMERVCPARMAL